MKHLSIILAIFFLGLSISPAFNGLCCGSPQENHEERDIHAHCNHYSQSENADKSSDEESQNHDCNSFCSCACCNIHVVVQQHFIATPSRIVHSESPTPFFPTFQYSIEYLPSIWQPPQIG